jgi:hypothetical protein
MAKVLFKLPGYYEGIRARRIKQSGRLWLVRVVNDFDKKEGGTFKPYWFVLIKGFDPIRDKASGGTSIGVWGFGYEDQASSKFAELEPLYHPFPVRPPTPAQLAVRNRVRLHGIRSRTPVPGQDTLKIHKGFPGDASKGHETPPGIGEVK